MDFESFFFFLISPPSLPYFDYFGRGGIQPASRVHAGKNKKKLKDVCLPLTLREDKVKSSIFSRKGKGPGARGAEII